MIAAVQCPTGPLWGVWHRAWGWYLTQQAAAESSRPLPGRKTSLMSPDLIISRETGNSYFYWCFPMFKYWHMIWEMVQCCRPIQIGLWVTPDPDLCRAMCWVLARAQPCLLAAGNDYTLILLLPSCLVAKWCWDISFWGMELRKLFWRNDTDLS